MSASEYYDSTGAPAHGSTRSSATMRAEFDAIQTGISAKLPDLSGNGGKIVAIESDASGLEAITTTGTGSGVRATSPTLVTPALGTPSAIVLTNATGTAISLVAGAANAIKSLTTDVSTAGATAPSIGQILTATGANSATWQSALADGTTATTQAAGDASTKVATTAFVNTSNNFTPAGTGAVATTVQAKLRESVSIADFLPLGYVTDGSVDYNTQITAAITYCKTLTAPHLLIPAGDYYIGTSQVDFDLPNYSTVTQIGRIKSAVAAGNTAVRIGSRTALTLGLRWHGLDVRRTAIEGTTSIGVDIVNLACSWINQRYTWGFGYGLYVNGYNNALSYLEMHIQYANDNKYNLYLTASGTGYCNENTFFGGSFGFSSSWFSAFGNYTGTYDIYEAYVVASPLNGNKFYSNGLESGGDDTVGLFIGGQNTHVYSPRLEAATPGFPTIVFDTNAINASVFGGAGVLLANIVDNSNNKSSTYYCKDGVVFGSTAGNTSLKVISTGSATATKAIEVLNSGLTSAFSVRPSGLVNAGTLALAERSLTYGVTIASDASLATRFMIPVTDAVGFTVSNPTNLPTAAPWGLMLIYTFSNNTAGAMGAISWGSAFKLSTFTSPATHKRKSICFIYSANLELLECWQSGEFSW